MAKDDFEKLGYTEADYKAPPPLTDAQRAAIARAIDEASVGWHEEVVSGLRVQGDPSRRAQKPAPAKPASTDK
jgi:hypothetical protein